MPLLLLFAFCWLQEPLPPEMHQLVKIKQRMADNLNHLPNYTCMVEIERWRNAPKATSSERTDVHRVEVALVGNDEWFSRPGAGRLETRELRELIPDGLVSSGDYANHSRSIFLSSVPRFEYAGNEKVNDREAVCFRYSVSLLNSGYRVHNGPSGAVVPYRGRFWADPKTGDLLRLEVTVDDIPLSVGLTEAVTTVDYVRVPIGGADFLLPVHTELIVTNLQGQAQRNRMTFTQCRQYGTESAVSFEPPETLPAGLALTLELDSAFDPDRLRGGDPVIAKLVSEVRSQEKTLIPVGATVRGRVLQLDRRPGPSVLVRLVLEFDQIVAGENKFHFNAVLESLTERQQVRRAPETTPRPGVLSLIVLPPFRLGGLVSTWRTQ